MGCSRCFPHGIEVVNSTSKNRQRSWKRHRNTQWKTREIDGMHGILDNSDTHLEDPVVTDLILKATEVKI